MNESEKKDKFIFEILEYVSIGLLSKELVELKNEIDYKKIFSSVSKKDSLRIIMGPL